MRVLHFDYCMQISYSVDVSRCHYTIKCIPCDNARQRIKNYKIEMTPDSRPEWAIDSLGNRYIFGCNNEPHSFFQYRIFGDVECGRTFYEEETTSNEEMIYRHNHGLNVPGDAIKAYYQKLKKKIVGLDGLSSLEKAKAMMKELYQDYVYEKGTTNITTSAEEALIIGKGVCQDYAHIMIALLHLAGCSARYAIGLIIGEGVSHAWVEVAYDGKWYGIDPTNNMLVGDEHIKIGVGRDATECQINRGIMHGGGDQVQTITVSVSEVSPGEKYLRTGVYST